MLEPELIRPLAHANTPQVLVLALACFALGLWSGITWAVLTGLGRGGKR